MNQIPPRSELYYPLADIVRQIRGLPDPVAAYKDFCKNLDPDSAITVSRQLAVNDIKPAILRNVLTPREYEKFMENIAILRYGVFKINDNCYALGKDMLPINHFEYSVFCARYGLDTIDLTKISLDAAIIDIGAFIGDSALIFRRYLKNKIYSFEPMPDNYKLMLKTIGMNGAGDQIIPVQMALTDTSDAKVFLDEQTAKGNISCYRTGDTQFGEALPSCALDDFVQTNNLKVGMIKVDIEGGEQSFLRGARATIERDRPIMLLSIYHPWTDLDYFNIKKMVESWGLGYGFRIFKPMDSHPMNETLLICEQ